MNGPPSTMFELRELEAFAAAVEVLSMHQAARVLGVTQSAVTKRIQTLEARLDVVLLERGRFGVRPTAAGDVLLPHAQAVLRALTHAGAQLHHGASTDPNSLRLSASHTVGEFLLPAWLAHFRDRAPDARTCLTIINSPGVLSDLRSQRCDVGFVEGRDALVGFDIVDLARDEIVAVVAADHPWAQRSSVPADYLRHEPFLTREPGSGTRAVAEAALASVGIRLTPSLETSSTGSLKQAVVDGGFTLISQLAVAVEQADGALAAVPVDGVDLRRSLRAVRVAEHPPSAIAEAFWTWLSGMPSTGRPAGVPDGLPVA